MNNFYKQWLNAAGDDILLMESIINNKELTHILAFHAQQAIEKSLKALLEYKKEKVLKSHSLNNLFSLLKDDITVDDFETITLIDQMYIESRYPGDMGLLPYGKPTIEDSKIFFDFAVDINKQIKQLTNGN